MIIIIISIMAVAYILSTLITTHILMKYYQELLQMR